MNRIFGRKGRAKPSTTGSGPPADRRLPDGSARTHHVVIERLLEAMVTQEKREAHIDRKIKAIVMEATEKMQKGDKKGAVLAWKRKKMYEAEVDKIQNVKMTLETQVMQLESVDQNRMAIGAMSEGAKAMSRIQAVAGIAEVDDVMDSIKEEQELCVETNAAMSQPIGPVLADDDDLLNELFAMEASDTEASLSKTG